VPGEVGLGACRMKASAYDAAMSQQSGRRHRRWWGRKYGPTFFLVFAVVCILGIVALLMWILTSPQFRVRPAP